MNGGDEEGKEEIEKAKHFLQLVSNTSQTMVARMANTTTDFGCLSVETF